MQYELPKTHERANEYELPKTMDRYIYPPPMTTHYYAWKNNPQMGLYPCPKRITLYGRCCRVVARLALGSVVVEFENGQRECVSRRALRRLTQAFYPIQEGKEKKCLKMNQI